MRQSKSTSDERIVKDIKRKTRKQSYCFMIQRKQKLSYGLIIPIFTCVSVIQGSQKGHGQYRPVLQS